MESKEIQHLLETQREFFLTGQTLSCKFRIQSLKKLYKVLIENKELVFDAIKSDLGKSDYESYLCEFGVSLTEITYMIKHLKKFSRRKRVHTNLALFPGKSYVMMEPFGNVLIMSPWNYPFLLTIEPLVDAIAAGNTAIVKPSAYSPATSNLIYKLISENFESKYISVILGGREENKNLLKQKFDFVFFTGSQSVGKEVLRNTAENLIPTVLELGGKSPCIIDSTADIKLAAKKIAFGKFLNCGQTCVAPDYILCHSKVKIQFLEEYKKQIIKQFGENPLENPDYGKIITEKHFNRLLGLIDQEKLYHGGKSNSRQQIEPTVLDNVTWEDKVMQEEIFGPIMPVLSFENLDELIATIQKREKALALYIFSRNQKNIKKIQEKIIYGGGCVNDVIIHLATSEMGFGGVGESGMGSYHGKTGFETFSHKKSILEKHNYIDWPIRYQPYKKGLYKKLLKMILK